MRFREVGSCALAVALVTASTAAAQDEAARPVDHAQLRHQIYVMEGALSRAVEFGAQSMNREIRAYIPEGFVLAGQARARGVYLEGYGVFFDVEVPIMRQSMIWSLKSMLDQDSAGLKKALADLRQISKNTADPASRQAAERAISRIELQLAPMGLQNGPMNPFAQAIQNAQQQQAPPSPSESVQAQGLATSIAQTTAAQSAPPTDSAQDAPRELPLDKPWMRDPNRAYTEAVQRAIVDAMIDYSAPMTIGADEYLTVAARDNYQRDSLAPPDPFEEVETILLRIKGSDLSAYRSGKIDREEARKRVTPTSF